MIKEYIDVILMLKLHPRHLQTNGVSFSEWASRIGFELKSTSLVCRIIDNLSGHLQRLHA